MKKKSFLIVILMLIFVLFINITYSFAAGDWKSVITDEGKKKKYKIVDTEKEAKDLYSDFKKIHISSFSDFKEEDLEIFINNVDSWIDILNNAEESLYLYNDLQGLSDTPGHLLEQSKKNAKDAKKNKQSQGGTADDAIQNPTYKDIWKHFLAVPIEKCENTENVEQAEYIYSLLTDVKTDKSAFSEYAAREWMRKSQALINDINFKKSTSYEVMLAGIRKKGSEIYEIYPNLGQEEEFKEFIKDNHMDLGEDGEHSKIYKQPTLADKNKNKGDLDEIISYGDDFTNKNTGLDDPISQDDIKDISKKVFNIVSEIAVGIAVLIGLILGIKLMLAGVNEKAEAKKMMWVYLVGCVVAFGAFGIWKVVIEILEKF